MSTRESMSDIDQTIVHRHIGDRWKDAAFIALALLLTVLSIGSVTSRSAGRAHEQPQWTVQVDYSGLEVGR